ncbi:MAG: DUF4115 domain-containing protein [Geminocystis sp.]|nr:DUF4115 domain-containing protein [Geminocystis sp.]HIK36701.1 DUF4115 domain-containing protein [Geminocystis sp. M7585_C2015_104]
MLLDRLNLFKPKSPPAATNIDYDAIRREKLSAIGNILREKRREFNYDLETVSRILHIPRGTIQALENGDLTRLPEPFFIRQLLVQYCKALRLNGEELVKDFPLQRNKPDVGRKNKKNLLRFHLSWRLSPKYLYLSYFLIVFFSVNSLSQLLQASQFSQSRIPLQQREKLEREKATTTSATTSWRETSVTRQNKPQSPSQSPSQPQSLLVRLTIKEDSWVRIVVDGKTSFEGVLNQGTEKQLTAKEKLTIRAGNAGGVVVSLNEEKAKQLGKLGEVKEVTFNLSQGS